MTYNRKIVSRAERKFSFFCFFSPGPHGKIKAEYVVKGKPVFALGDTHEEAAENLLAKIPREMAKRWLKDD